MATRELDVAIVGAGVSGVWCGWRLTGDSAGSARRRRVAVFELADRVGGRLLSVRLPGAADVACELGGMRYMSTQTYVPWLVEKVLGLPRMAAPVAEDANIAYLRGIRLRLSDLTDPKKVPYWLEPDEWQHVADGGLLSYAIETIAPKTKNKTGDELRKAVRTSEYGGRPLAEQGFWNLLLRVLSDEAFRFAQQSGGYDTTQLNWNAADTIVLNADFTPDVTFSRIETGYEQVPKQLAEHFVAQGGELHLQRGVRSVEPVTLDDGSTGVELVIEDVRTKRTKAVRARAVILALPRRSLELLDPTGPVLGDRGFRRLIESVTPIPLYKAFVAYHEPWWTKVGVTSGRSVTDLPLRQIYYWSTKPRQSSVLLATYDDTDNVGFWQGLASQPRTYGLELDHVPAAARKRILSDHRVDDRWMSEKAPPPLVHELHRQLEQVHGVDGAPRPYAAVFHDWVGDPFGGGVNFWNIGVKSWRVMPKIAHPVAAAPVYVCGEAYSDAQGWVEGALRSAELVLTRHLKLPKLTIPPA